MSMSENALNVGATLEESQKLVAYWHNRWANIRDERDSLQTRIDFVNADPRVQYTVRLYGELAPDDRRKIDELMRALMAITKPTPEESAR